MNIKKIIEKYRVVIFVVVAILFVRFLPDKNNNDIDLEKFKGIADLSQSINEQVQENIDYISGKDDEIDTDIVEDATKKIAADIDSIKPENDQERDLLTIMKEQKNFVEKDIKAQEIFNAAQSSIPMDQLLLPQNLHSEENIEQSLRYVKIMQDSTTKYMQTYNDNYNTYVTELEKNLIDKKLVKTVRYKSKKGFDVLTNANNKALEGYKLLAGLLEFCKNSALSNSIEFDGEKLLFQTDEQIAIYNDFAEKIDKNIEEHNIALQAMQDYAKQNAETTAKIFK